MLVLDPTRRYTISQIKHHRWFCPQMLELLNVSKWNKNLEGTSNIEPDENILRVMSEFAGIAPEKTRNSLKKNSYDHIAAIYLLLQDRANNKKITQECLVRNMSLPTATNQDIHNSSKELFNHSQSVNNHRIKTSVITNTTINPSHKEHAEFENVSRNPSFQQTVTERKKNPSHLFNNPSHGEYGYSESKNKNKSAAASIQCSSYEDDNNQLTKTTLTSGENISTNCNFRKRNDSQVWTNTKCGHKNNTDGTTLKQSTEDCRLMNQQVIILYCIYIRSQVLLSSKIPCKCA